MENRAVFCWTRNRKKLTSAIILSREESSDKTQMEARLKNGNKILKSLKKYKLVMARGPSRVTALEIPDLPRNPMADLVLSCRDRASFCSSVWSSWTSAPFDLNLVAEV